MSCVCFQEPISALIITRNNNIISHNNNNNNKQRIPTSIERLCSASTSWWRVRHKRRRRGCRLQRQRRALVRDWNGYCCCCCCCCYGCGHLRRLRVPQSTWMLCSWPRRATLRPRPAPRVPTAGTTSDPTTTTLLLPPRASTAYSLIPSMVLGFFIDSGMLLIVPFVSIRFHSLSLSLYLYCYIVIIIIIITTSSSTQQTELGFSSIFFYLPIYS